jgi:hypothetical protein
VREKTPAEKAQKTPATLIKESLDVIEAEMRKCGSSEGLVAYANLAANLKEDARRNLRTLAEVDSEMRRQTYLRNRAKTALENILGTSEGRLEEAVSGLIGENHALRNACATEWGAPGSKVHRKACEYCGKAYVSQRSDRKYCSNSCRNKQHAEKAERSKSK